MVLNPFLCFGIRQFWDAEAPADLQYLQIINWEQSTVLAGTQNFVCLCFGREGIMGTRQGSQNYSRQTDVFQDMEFK